MGAEIGVKPSLSMAFSGAPHVLMELSVRIFNRYKKNSIILNGINVTNGIVNYYHVEHGEFLNER